MAILTQVYRDNREKSQNLYYGRAVILNTLTSKDLAKIMQNNCTLKESDILACISELIDVMTTQLQNSNAIKLDGFGTFKVGLKTIGATSAKNFTCSDNVTGFRVNFLPEGHKSTTTGKIERTFLADCKAKKYDE